MRKFRVSNINQKYSFDSPTTVVECDNISIEGASICFYTKDVVMAVLPCEFYTVYDLNFNISIEEDK